MNTAILPTNFESFIFQSGDDLKTTSLKVAEAFQKRHDDVLKKLRSLECSTDFNARNFAEVEYTDAKGEKRPAYEMTKDGFMFLVMGFTGKAAAQIKEAYINAFNLMHAKLFPKRNGLVDLPVSPFVTSKEKLLLRTAIEKHVAKTKEAHSYYWHRLHHAYHVSRLEDLPTGKVDEMLAFLGLREPTLDEYVIVKQEYLLELEQQVKALPAPVQSVSFQIPNSMALVATKWIQELEQKSSLKYQFDDLKFVVEKSGGLVLTKCEVDRMKGVLKA